MDTAKAEPAASAVTTNSLCVRFSSNRRLRGLSYIALLLSQSAKHPFLAPGSVAVARATAYGADRLRIRFAPILITSVNNADQ